MEKNTDAYKTLEKASEEVLLKEKKSKFFSQAFPVNSEEAIKSILEQIKKKHPQSGHVCYAWQLGVESQRYRVNDDGEPNNSAGMPIYGQIQSFEITNSLVTVTRYFGGTKLGVGGLISAYREAAKMALETSEIVEKQIAVHFQLNFPYSALNKVMRIIKQHSLVVLDQKMELECQIEIKVRKSDSVRVLELFESSHKVNIKTLN